MDVKLMLEEAIRIARLAGSEIQALRESRQFTESLKEGCELVTTADLASHELIKAEISRVFPGHRLLSEEGADDKPLLVEDPTWIVDPIDGTVGYANGHYQVAVSIAFAAQNRVWAGAVYNPFLGEMFHASLGGGAFLNRQPISIKQVHDLRQCVIGTGWPHERDNIDDVISNLEGLLPRVRDIRRLGSPALDICWVACGRMQGFYEGKLHPWDVAAAKLIAAEAGASIGHYGGKLSSIPACLDGNQLLVSSPGVYAELQRILSS